MMAGEPPGQIRIRKLARKQADDSQDSSFWSMLTLDHYSLDKELDDAALRAYERLHYGQHGRPRPQVDVEETNRKTTVDKRAEVRRSRSRDKKPSRDGLARVSQQMNRKNNATGEDARFTISEQHRISAESKDVKAKPVSSSRVTASIRNQKEHQNNRVKDKVTIPAQSCTAVEKKTIKENEALRGGSSQCRVVQPSVTKNNCDYENDKVNLSAKQQTASEEQRRAHKKQAMSNQVDNKEEDVINDTVKDSVPTEPTTKPVDGVSDTAASAEKVEAVSSLPKEAKLQFLWRKTISTKVNSVKLKLDKIKGLIVLHYVPERDVYLSDEISIPCDDYKCCLLVAEKVYKIEPVEVKHYTFEVDLYIEEDEEDTAPAARTPPPLKQQPRQRPSGSRGTTIPSGVIKETRASPERTRSGKNECLRANSDRDARARPSEPSANRTTPIVARRRAGDNMDDVMEGDEGEIRRSNRLEMLLRQQMASKAVAADGVVEEDVYLGGADGLRRPRFEGFRPVSAQNSTVSSKQSIGGSSSEHELNKYLGGGEGPRGAVQTAMTGGGQISRSRSVDTLNREVGVSYSVTYRSPDSTPTPSGRHEYDATKRNEYDNSGTPYDVDYEAGRVADVQTASTPSGDYKPPLDFHRSRDHDGYASSDQSLSSLPAIHAVRGGEQREAGYLEQSERQLGRGALHQPAIRTPLVTTRTTLPVRVNHSDREDPQRMRDLEQTVSSLQLALAERDRDLQLVTRERCHLSEELQRLRHIYETPTEGRDQNEKRINQLIQEKENLATEVWKLKRQLDELKQNKAESERAGSDQTASEQEPSGCHDNHLDNYNPNNPNALQRKLGDLQSQLQDMNEAHESTINKLSTSEREISKLKDENHSLRMTLRSRSQEIEIQNMRLREQITRLQDDDDQYLRHELAQVKEELQVLRNKNHQLMQDNIKLTEHLRRVDTRNSQISADSLDIRRTTKSPGYDLRKPDPLLDGGHSTYTSAKTGRPDEDEQFMRDRNRLTQELHQMAVPQKWSERDFRNNGSEGPLIRLANRDPFSRAKSAPPIRHRDSGEAMTVAADQDSTRNHLNFEENHKETYEENGIDRRQGDEVNYHGMRQRERSLERLSGQGLNGLEQRNISSLQETRLYNGYNGQHERRLSENSNATIELTRACPLGEGQAHSMEMVDKFSHGQMMSSNGHNAPDSKHMTSDFHLRAARKHSDPVGDVLDNLNRPPSTRCHLKVDLVDDVLNGVRIKQTPYNMSTPARDVLPDRRDGIQGHVSTNLSCDQSGGAGGHSQHNSSSGTQNSMVDDLLDASVDDPGFKRHTRRDSLDSCSTDAILHAAEEEMNQLNVEKMPVACESRGLSPSLRSASPRPVLTQHNKGVLGTLFSKHSSHSYAAKRPFAPRTPADVNIGDIVKFCRHGGKISKGVVKYIGHLPGKHDTYLGLELEHEMAKHDGVYEGVRYFQSKPNRGVFVAFSKVVMAWGD